MDQISDPLNDELTYSSTACAVIVHVGILSLVTVLNDIFSRTVERC
jgi:hypothetical protein